mmetsp:Transcript_53086/g.166776  ORF Transcript_53086/g.166776 Transcript_53086/m.166776 type:complete len:647 (+) Transcript_53086:456-2396(+)
MELKPLLDYREPLVDLGGELVAPLDQPIDVLIQLLAPFEHRLDARPHHGQTLQPLLDLVEPLVSLPDLVEPLANLLEPHFHSGSLAVAGPQGAPDCPYRRHCLDALPLRAERGTNLARDLGASNLLRFEVDTPEGQGLLNRRLKELSSDVHGHEELLQAAPSPLVPEEAQPRLHRHGFCGAEGPGKVLRLDPPAHVNLIRDGRPPAGLLPRAQLGEKCPHTLLDAPERIVVAGLLFGLRLPPRHQAPGVGQEALHLRAGHGGLHARGGALRGRPDSLQEPPLQSLRCQALTCVDGLEGRGAGQQPGREAGHLAGQAEGAENGVVVDGGESPQTHDSEEKHKLRRELHQDKPHSRGLQRLGSAEHLRVAARAEVDAKAAVVAETSAPVRHVTLLGGGDPVPPGLAGPEVARRVLLELADGVPPLVVAVEHQLQRQACDASNGRVGAGLVGGEACLWGVQFARHVRHVQELGHRDDYRRAGWDHLHLPPVLVKQDRYDVRVGGPHLGGPLEDEVPPPRRVVAVRQPHGVVLHRRREDGLTRRHARACESGILLDVRGQKDLGLALAPAPVPHGHAPGVECLALPAGAPADAVRVVAPRRPVVEVPLTAAEVRRVRPRRVGLDRQAGEDVVGHVGPYSPHVEGPEKLDV